jgi:hypothetical protein
MTNSVFEKDDVDVRRKHLVGDGVVHVAIRVLHISRPYKSQLYDRDPTCCMATMLTLKKFSLMSCVVSIGLPDTGSAWIQLPAAITRTPSQSGANPASSRSSPHSLVLYLRTYGTMFNKSNTSARVGSSVAMTATGFRKGCSERAQQSLNIS